MLFWKKMKKLLELYNLLLDHFFFFFFFFFFFCHSSKPRNDIHDQKNRNRNRKNCWEILIWPNFPTVLAGQIVPNHPALKICRHLFFSSKNVLSNMLPKTDSSVIKWRYPPWGLIYELPSWPFFFFEVHKYSFTFVMKCQLFC